MINTFLATVGADFRGRVIEIDPRDTSYIFAVQAAIEAGDLVAVLGDRVGVNEKTATAQFLGAPARFPTGPYTLAALLRCPVYLTFGLYRAPDRYDLYCEPLAQHLELPGAPARRPSPRTSNAMPNASSTTAVSPRTTGSTSLISGGRRRATRE